MKELFLSICYTGITGLISFFVGAALPRHWFHAEKPPFAAYRFEKEGKIYEYLNIKKWKGEIIDMSKIMNNILPKKVSVSAKLKDIQALISETCVAEAVHWWLCLISAANYWIWQSAEGILIWILCIIGNMPFILVQRYNRPHLQRIIKKMQKIEKYQKSEG